MKVLNQTRNASDIEYSDDFTFEKPMKTKCHNVPENERIRDTQKNWKKYRRNRWNDE